MVTEVQVKFGRQEGTYKQDKITGIEWEYSSRRQQTHLLAKLIVCVEKWWEQRL